MAPNGTRETAQAPQTRTESRCWPMSRGPHVVISLRLIQTERSRRMTLPSFPSQRHAQTQTTRHATAIGRVIALLQFRCRSVAKQFLNAACEHIRHDRD
jgi:hypothetical protein